MEMLPKLGKVADAWVEAQRRTSPDVALKTLGSRAVGNAKLFDRKGMNVETFQRVALWLGDAANWPMALVPNDAADALAELGVLVPADQRLVFPAVAA